MNYGSKYGFDKFFHMNSINGRPFVPGYSEATYKKCSSLSIIGSADGSGLPPYVKKTDELKLYQYMLPIPYPTYYRKTLRRGLLRAYEFGMDDAIYVRSNVTGVDCFGITGNVDLPDGLIDTSGIAFGESHLNIFY